MVNHRMTNWAGNVAYRASRFHRPSTVEELRGLVAGAERVRAVGTGHSFSGIGDTTGDLVFTDGLPEVFQLDSRDRTVTVSCGTRLGVLSQRLHEAGFALPNLPSLPHISVAGACATGTHGSGTRNLATFVRSVELVTSDGSMTRLGPQAVLVLGELGVVIRLTVEVVPDFVVRQYVYEDLPFERVEETLRSAYSVSVFTDWKQVTQVWRKCVRADQWRGARAADRPRHPIAGMSPDACTEQLGVPGPWHERLPHFRLSHMPSSGDELQSEYFVALGDAGAAMEALRGIDFEGALQISELRTVLGDELWLSPAYGRDSLAIHFTWISDAARVMPKIEAVERALAPLDPRPHWGKLSVASGRYPRMADFLALKRRWDPLNKFSLEEASGEVGGSRGSADGTAGAQAK
jgi:xylitol oxidase